MPLVVFLAALLLAGAEVIPAHTETISLAPVADTSLFELEPDNNLGGGETLVAGSNGQLSRSRALLKFDVAGSVPTNAVITAVALTLTVVALPGGTTATATEFKLHRLLKAWGEGDKTGNNGAAAAAGQATWNARLAPDSRWSVAGAAAPEDFTATASASATVTGLAGYNFESDDLMKDAQHWLEHPETNFGWIIMNGSESTTRGARRFGSREGTSPPSLLIQYREESDEFRIEAAELTPEYFLVHLDLPAGSRYAVQFRDSLATGPWQVFTNFPALDAFQHFILAEPRSENPQRFYRVEVLPP